MSLHMFVSRENHAWYLIPSPRLPPAAPQSPTPALCLWTTPPSQTQHYRLPQVRDIHRSVYYWLCGAERFNTPVKSAWDLRITLIIDSSVLLFCPIVCVYLNKYGKVGPHLDQRRIQQLPDHFGPGRASSVLQQCVQACVDSAHNQATVFSCLKSGQGGEVISGGDYIIWEGIWFLCLYLFESPH